MKIFSYDINISSMANKVNPANWRPEVRRAAVRVGSMTIVAFVALTALEMLPKALAATSEYIYNCDFNAELNAGYAYVKVLADTWDAEKAKAAASFMYEVGLKVDKYVSGHSVAVKLCQTVADTLPYKY